MKINNIGNVYGVYTNKAKGPVKAEAKTSGGKDSVAISGFGHEMQVAKQALSNVSDIRYEVVDKIKEQMEAGKYNVTASMLADKLLQNIEE